MKSANGAIGFIVASRIPNLIIIGAAQWITAFCLLNKSISELLSTDFLLFIFSTGLIGAAGYIINDYFDQKIDLINRPQSVIVGTHLRRRIAILAHIFITFCGISLGFLLDPFIGAIHVFSAGALWTYSVFLKRILLLGTLTISFLTSLTLLIVMVYFKEFNLLVVSYALFGGVAIFVRESIKDIISAKGEKHFGFNSIPIVWGIRGAKVAIYIGALSGISMLTFYLLSIPNWTMRYFFLTVMVFVFWILYQLAKADQLNQFRKIKKYVDLIILVGLVSMFLI